MPIPLEELLVDFSLLPGATEEVIQTAESMCGVALPEDYRAFLMRGNGGEGFIGQHYLILWRAEELHPFNTGYQVAEYAPGFLMFGSTGGGDGFAFDTRTTPFRVMQVPFIGMSLDDAFYVAENFMRLLERMSQIDGPLF